MAVLNSFFVVFAGFCRFNSRSEWRLLRVRLAVLCLLLSLVFCKNSWAQNTITFESSVDKKQVPLNEYIEVNFSVRNTLPDNFVPPSFEGFNIAGGPNQNSEISIVNGAVVRSITYSFFLAPKSVGTYTIAPASMKYKGRTWQTQPLSVTVLKSNGQANNAPSAAFPNLPKNVPLNLPNSQIKHTLSDAQLAKGVFLRAELSKTEAFVGEQITVAYKLYTRYNLSSKQLTALPHFQGFFPIDFKQFDSNTKRENIGGVGYVVQTLRKIALYPQETGSLTVDALALAVGVQDEAQNDPSASPSWNNNQRARTIEVRSIPATVLVRDLPRPLPANFSGGVGVYNIQSVVTPTSITTDNALTVTLSVTGSGDLKRVGMPALNPNDTTAFTAYEPTLTDRSEETINEITSQKNYEITLIPRKIGSFVLLPTFTYFDTNLKAYKTLSPKKFDIQVAQGKKTLLNYNRADTIAARQQIIRLLRPIHTNFTLAAAQKDCWNSPFFLLFLIFPFAISAAMLAYRNYLRTQTSAEPSALAAKRAYQTAKTNLATAQKCHENNNTTDFYKYIQKTLLQYITDKFSVENSALSKTFMSQFFNEKGLENAVLQPFLSVLEQCEQMRYGGSYAADARKKESDILAQTAQILVDLEAFSKKIL